MLPQKTLGRDSIGRLQFLGVADGTRESLVCEQINPASISIPK